MSRSKKETVLVIGEGDIPINENLFRVVRVTHWTPRDWTTEVQSQTQDERFDYAIVLPTAQKGKYFWDQLAWRVHRAVTVIQPTQLDYLWLKRLYSSVQLKKYKYIWAVAQFSEFRDYKGVDQYA